MGTREQSAAIDDFWAWWGTVKAHYAESFKAPMSEALISAMSDHVLAIDEALEWEFGPGLESTHYLCVSSAGDPVLRVLTERWLRGAPAREETWEYHPARPPGRVAGLTIDIGGESLALDQMRATVEQEVARELVHVRVYHPAFAGMKDQDLRGRAAMIALDALLGEDAFERWVGGVEVSNEPLAQDVSWAVLGRIVATFARSATGDRWAVLKGETNEGLPVFISANLAVKRVAHLLFDTHVELTATLRAPTPEGLPTSEESEALNASEDALLAGLGADAIYFGRETYAGKRVWHFHVMEGGPAAAKLAAWKAKQQHAIEVKVAPDPMWEILQRWR